MLIDQASHRAKGHATLFGQDIERTVWEVFQQECPKLIAYAGCYDGFWVELASVSKRGKRYGAVLTGREPLPRVGRVMPRVHQ